MTEVFLNILNRSICASWLILAVLVLRFFLKRVPKWVHVLLWGIVAVRLLCPVSIESSISLVPSAETVRPEIMTDWSPRIDTGVPALDAVANPAVSDAFTPRQEDSANPLQIWLPVCAGLWAAGVAVLLAYTAVSYCLLRRKVASAVLLRYNVFQSAQVPAPFVLGIVKPRVYLPCGMLAEDIFYVVAHEKAHIRRRDHWWKPLGFLLLSVHWFNPLMWLAYQLLSRDIELACDEYVIESMTNVQRADYAQALLNCSVKKPVGMACPIAFGEVGVKARIRSVMNYRRPRFWIVLLAVILCAAVAVCFLTDPKQKAPVVHTQEPADPTQPAQASPGGQAEVQDLAYILELAVPGKHFQTMDPEIQEKILAEYRDLLDDHILLGRESTDGTMSYIAGYFSGPAEDNPFRGMYEHGSVEVDRALITEEIQDTPEAWYIIESSDILYSADDGFVLILPKESSSQKDGYTLARPNTAAQGLRTVFGMYRRPNGRAYILDALSRGIALCTPEGPYLEVHLISELWGECAEWIPLTEEEAARILSEDRKTLEPGTGFSARLHLGPDSAVNLEETAGWYTEFLGAPQTVLDLAAEKCSYKFDTPKDIQSGIVEARLDCDWLEEPRYAEDTDLARLQAILARAEFGFVGKCGYGARLTIRMADGGEMVLFKGTDSCDTLVFGSYGGYFIGDAENLEFWSIFDLDPGSKQPLN